MSPSTVTAETRVDLTTLGADVAAALGPGWQAVVTNDREPPTWVHLEGPDGAAVSMHVVTYPRPPRLSISGVFPRDPQGGGDFGPSGYGTDQRVTIRVATGRPAAAIAGEIRRRLLPTYLPQHAKACERQAATETGRQDAERLARRLAELLGEPFNAETPGRGQDRYIRLYREAWYVDVSVSEHGHVKIDLRSLPAAVAEAVCRALPRKVAA